MLTSSMTPFRSTSRLRISSGLKQHRYLELHQQLTTHNGFFNNYRKNGNAFAVTTSTRARIGSFKTNHRQPLKSSRPGFVTLWLPSSYILLREYPILGTLCVEAAPQQPTQSMSALHVSSHGVYGVTSTQPLATLTSTYNKIKQPTSSSPTSLHRVECILVSHKHSYMLLSSGSLPLETASLAALERSLVS